MEIKNEQELWYPYFRATPEVHDGSGFYCFEVGYCQVGENAEIKNKAELSHGFITDHIAIWNLLGKDKDESFINSLSIDCLKDGYIRIFNAQHGLHWEPYPQVRDAHAVATSSMWLAAGWPIPPDPSTNTNYALQN